MVRLFPEVMQFPGEVRTGELYLDGNILCTPDESGVKGRRRLSFGGHIVVSVVVDGRGTISSGPDIAIEGLPEVEDDEESVTQLVRNVVNGTLKSIPPKRRADADVVESALQRSIRGEVNAWWGKKPNVTVFVHRV
jgi:ribonuclease J